MPQGQGPLKGVGLGMGLEEGNIGHMNNEMGQSVRLPQGQGPLKGVGLEEGNIGHMNNE